MSSEWTEHRNAADGRKYWYHSSTKQSVWEVSPGWKILLHSHALPALLPHAHAVPSLLLRPFPQKPQELKTPTELALADLGWKQYESNGRPYYVNDTTKETTWEIPADVKSELSPLLNSPAGRHSGVPTLRGSGSGRRHVTARVEEAAAAIAASRASAAPSSPAPFRDATPGPGAASGGVPNRPSTNTPLATNGSPIPTGPAADRNTPTEPAAMQVAGPGSFVPGQGPTNLAHPAQHAPPQRPTPRIVDLNFKTKEDAEEAFYDVLRRHNVTPQWTWEQVLRETVTDPYFRSLRTLGERKAAFEKYIEELKRKEREIKEKSMEKNRPAWRTALGRLSEGDYGMKSWWSWERASREIRTRMNDVWLMAKNDDERESLWREYMEELKTKEEIRQAEVRQYNIEKLAVILKNLDLDPSVRFQDGLRIVRDTKEWKDDPELQIIEPLDFLIVFEESIKRAEQEYAAQKQREKIEKQRLVRKTRQAYIDLLEELRAQGRIKSGTKWKEIYPLISKEERFQDVLCNPGSTPLELFWDIVDDLDQKIEEDSRIIENAMQERGFEFKYKPGEYTTFEELDSKIGDHLRVKNMKIEDRKAVYKGLIERHEQLLREEKRRMERRLRHQIEDLRYGLRKVEPPIGVETTYEDALPKFKDLPEYIDLKDEDARRSAFDKYIQRQREKIAEKEKEREREAKLKERTSSSFRDRDRDRDRHSERDRERDRDHERDYSDTESHSSHRRRRRHSSKVENGRTPRRDSGVSDAGSPLRSDSKSLKAREYSPEVSSSRRDRDSRRDSTARDRSKDRSSRPRERSEDRTRDRYERGSSSSRRHGRDRGERERERDDGGSTRSHRDRERDYPSDDERRGSDKRRSSRREEDEHDREDANGDSKRRSSSRRAAEGDVKASTSEKRSKPSSSRHDDKDLPQGRDPKVRMRGLYYRTSCIQRADQTFVLSSSLLLRICRESRLSTVSR